MKTLGIIAGGGELPCAVAREARGQGVGRIVAVGFHGQTLPEIEREVDEFHWVHVGQLSRLIKTLCNAGAFEAVMAGRLDPKFVISSLKLDLRMLTLAARVRDRRPNTVLKAIAGEMEKDGIRLLDSTLYLTSLLAREGVKTRTKPAAAVR
ncbi:MAG: hypothetical protein NT045_00725, partial [Candidatus Aureabacteria bacterium]|nr:hypothetical protein [Candidatus Auribacterota bacterium]